MAAKSNNIVVKVPKNDIKEHPKMYHSTPFVQKPLAVCKPTIPAANRLRKNIVKKPINYVSKPHPIIMKPPSKPLTKLATVVMPKDRRNMKPLTIPVPFSFESRYKKPTTNRW
ncbi:hypothetical protein MXB_5391 [Myxobolus squamalis]|nr:hypothetical protein MXB_5391 [Myxobolus squamalis]